MTTKAATDAAKEASKKAAQDAWEGERLAATDLELAEFATSRRRYDEAMVYAGPLWRQTERIKQLEAHFPEHGADLPEPRLRQDPPSSF